MTLMSALLASTPDPTKWIGPGLLGFIVIAGIGVATFLLWRNMNKQIRRVDFEEEPVEPPEGEQATGPGAAQSKAHEGESARAESTGRKPDKPREA